MIPWKGFELDELLRTNIKYERLTLRNLSYGKILALQLEDGLVYVDHSSGAVDNPTLYHPDIGVLVRATYGGPCFFGGALDLYESLNKYLHPYTLEVEDGIWMVKKGAYAFAYAQHLPFENLRPVSAADRRVLAETNQLINDYVNDLKLDNHTVDLCRSCSDRDPTHLIRHLMRKEYSVELLEQLCGKLSHDTEVTKERLTDSLRTLVLRKCLSHTVYAHCAAETKDTLREALWM